MPHPGCLQIGLEALTAHGQEEGGGYFVRNADPRYGLNRITASLPRIGAAPVATHADWTTRFADHATVVIPPATRH
jgi:hypothetical protein